MENEKRLPPKWMLNLARTLIHPDFQEDIEGDLLEIYQQNISRSGVRKSNWLFFREVVLLLRVNLTRLNFLNKRAMKKKDILFLALICLALLAGTTLPFLQGPFSIAAVIVSGISQSVVETLRRCDLLSKSVHCNVENNTFRSILRFNPVVICFQNQFIAMSKTTWFFNWKKLRPL